MLKFASSGRGFDPDQGGVTIPKDVRERTTQRILAYAERHFKGHYTRIDVRYRGQFCYIDAYQEPVDLPGWPPPGGPESREEYLERLRNTPTHLCRLRYYGDEQAWGFAFYKYSDETYETSVYRNNRFLGTPEAAFDISAGVYLLDR